MLSPLSDDRATSNCVPHTHQSINLGAHTKTWGMAADISISIYIYIYIYIMGISSNTTSTSSTTTTAHPSEMFTYLPSTDR